MKRPQRVYRWTLGLWFAGVVAHWTRHMVLAMERPATDEVYAQTLWFQIAAFAVTSLPYWVGGLLVVLLIEFVEFGRARPCAGFRKAPGRSGRAGSRYQFNLRIDSSDEGDDRCLGRVHSVSTGEGGRSWRFKYQTKTATSSAITLTGSSLSGASSIGAKVASVELGDNLIRTCFQPSSMSAAFSLVYTLTV